MEAHHYKLTLCPDAMIFGATERPEKANSSTDKDKDTDNCHRAVWREKESTSRLKRYYIIIKRTLNREERQ